MVINNNTATSIGDILYIKLVAPYERVTNVLSYTDELIGVNDNAYFKKEFRWSTNDVTYSDWVELTDENLQTLSLDPEKNFWIQYKYEVVAIEPGRTLKFISIQLETETSDGMIIEIPQSQITDNDDSGMIANLVVQEGDCVNQPYNPYDIKQSTNNYEQLSCVVSTIFGHDAKYFKADPDKNSEDVVFLEYSLLNVSSMKDIKILFPNNELPTREIGFDDLLGIDLPDMVEIHIVKSEFKDAFGIKSMPAENDYLYIPIINKIFDVNSVYNPDDFMYSGSYYKVSLVNHQDRQNIGFDNTADGQEAKDEIEALITGVNDVLRPEQEEEEIKVTNPLQLNTIGTGDKDHIRSSINKSLSIIEEKIKVNYAVVSKYHYALPTVPLGEAGVVYRYNKGFDINDNRSITWWVRRNERINRTAVRVLDIVRSTDGKFELVTNGHPYEVGTVFKLSNNSRLNGSYKVISRTDTNIIIDKDHEVIPNRTALLRKLDSDAFMVYGDREFEMFIFDESIQISINNTTHVFDLSLNNVKIENGKWYGMILNISNMFNQLSLFIYESMGNKSSYKASEELKNIYYKTIIMNEKLSLPNDKNWMLMGCDSDITNIRIYNTPIEFEEHSLVLTQYLVQDANKAYLIDNALPGLKLASVSNNR